MHHQRRTTSFPACCHQLHTYGCARISAGARSVGVALAVHILPRPRPGPPPRAETATAQPMMIHRRSRRHDTNMTRRSRHTRPPTATGHRHTHYTLIHSALAVACGWLDALLACFLPCLATQFHPFLPSLGCCCGWGLGPFTCRMRAPGAVSRARTR